MSTNDAVRPVPVRASNDVDLPVMIEIAGVGTFAEKHAAELPLLKCDCTALLCRSGGYREKREKDYGNTHWVFAIVTQP